MHVPFLLMLKTWIKCPSVSMYLQMAQIIFREISMMFTFTVGLWGRMKLITSTTCVQAEKAYPGWKQW